MAAADEVFELARDFDKASGAVTRGLYSAFKDAGDAFVEDWRANARETSGTHGKHYPESITAETKVSTSIVVEAGPETRRKQGRMGRGFELGSENQPPHLDGLRAMPAAEKRIERAADAALGHLLP